MSQLDLCGRCGHTLNPTHIGRSCKVDVVIEGDVKTCPCPVGVRADVFACGQNAEIIRRLAGIDRTLNKLLTLQAEALGIEITDNDDGTINLLPKKAGLVVPGH